MVFAILLLNEASAGKLYELIVTSYSGLYRYDLHDIVKLSEGSDRHPRIEFICKSNDNVIFGEKKLYAWHLTKMIEEYEENTSSRITLFQGRMNEDGLELYIEPMTEFDISRFDIFMKEKLNEAGIPLASVTLYEKGYRNSLFEKIVEGKSLSATKLPVFLTF